MGGLSRSAHDHRLPEALVTPNAPIVFLNNRNSTLCRPENQARTARVRVVVAPMTHAQTSKPVELGPGVRGCQRVHAYA